MVKPSEIQLFKVNFAFVTFCRITFYLTISLRLVFPLILFYPVTVFASSSGGDLLLAGVGLIAINLLLIIFAVGLLILLLIYLSKHKRWGIFAFVLVSTMALFLIQLTIKLNFSRLCDSVATTKVYTNQRIKSYSIFIPQVKKDTAVNHGDLDIRVEALNDYEYGFVHVETNRYLTDNKTTRITNNGNTRFGIDEIASPIELEQTISTYKTTMLYSIDMSKFVIKDRTNNRTLAEKTILVLKPKLTYLFIVEGLLLPSTTYCGDAPKQTDIKYYGAHQIDYAWGRRALAFSLLVADPITAKSLDPKFY